MNIINLHCFAYATGYEFEPVGALAHFKKYANPPSKAIMFVISKSISLRQAATTFKLRKEPGL